MFRWIIPLIIIFPGLFLFPKNSLALTISPTLVELNLKPGESVSRVVKIYNETNTEISVKSEANKIVSGDKNDEVKILPFGDDDSKTWIVAIPSFTLAPQTLMPLNFTVKAPAEALPGTRAEALLFTAVPTSNDLSGVSVLAKTGPVVLINVAGETRINGNLLSFEMDNGRSIQEFLPDNFKLKIENKGTVYFIPDGQIIIKNIFGQEIKKIDVNTEGRRVLPNWKRTFEVQTRKNSALNRWKKEFDPFMIGPASATVTLNLGGEKIEKRLMFWVVPWRTIISALAVLGGSFLLIRLRKR